MEPMLLELVGKQGALMGGKGGSMHLTSVEHGVMGSYAIVGAHLPIAVGAAWSAQYRGTRPGGGLLLRRRDDEHRRVPRGAEPGRRVEGAGRLRLREQPVHGVHAPSARSPRSSARGRPRGEPTGWSRWSSTATTWRRCTPWRGSAIDRARAGERSVAGRGDHLPPRRALARRPRHLSAGGGGQGLAGARPDPGAARAPGRGGRRRHRSWSSWRRRFAGAGRRRREGRAGSARPGPGRGHDPALGRWRLRMAAS